MTIKKFKAEGSYTVEFETDNGEEIKIKTGERPEKELFDSMAAFIRVALGYYGAAKEGIFYCLTATQDVSRLVIDIPTQFLGEFARVSFQPVDRSTIYTKDMEPDREHPRNEYNSALEGFLDQVENFAKGQHAQLELPFEDRRQAADKITKFPKVAKQ
jgi:hypothetical protein